ncbi:hypothetical protein MACK_002311 [Theileria orientalis]|uniref:PH domain-containing protein n=1 Tax=Theileria orientalis TaxID=68886 RepID=A0A976MBX6_THEOR|nr:hypothetical protein MACK_002311 [Theileria orientalis]
MTESEKQYKSQSPSNPPLKEKSKENRKVLGGNLDEKIVDRFNKRNIYKNTGVLNRELSGNTHLVHISKDLNVVSPKIDLKKNINVVKSDLISKEKGFNNLISKNKENNVQYKAVSNIQSILSEFEPKKTVLVSNNSNKRYNGVKNYIGDNNSNYSNEQLKQIIKLGRANLNVVKDFRKDAPVSRLPIMYKDDVEALLSRKPNSVRNFVNSLNKQLGGYTDYNNRHREEGKNMCNMDVNNRNNCSISGCVCRKLDESNFASKVQNSGVRGHYDECREYLDLDKYSPQSLNLRLNINGGDFEANCNRNNNSNPVDGGCNGKGDGNDKEHGLREVQEDEMMTYRSNTFGSFARRSPMSNCAKSVSDLCGSVTSDFVYSRNPFYHDGNGGNYTSGGPNEFNYVTGDRRPWDYRTQDASVYNCRVDDAENWNYRTDRVMSIGTNESEGYGGLAMDGGYYNFSSYFNRNFNNGYEGSCYAEGISEEESFKNAKLTCRTSLTGVNSDEYEDHYCTVNSDDNGESGEERADSVTKNRKLGDLIFSKRFLQSFNTLPEGVNLVIDTPKSQMSNETHLNMSGALESTSRLDSGTGRRVERRSVLEGIDVGNSVVDGPTRLKIARNGRVERRKMRSEKVVVNSVNLIKSGWVWVKSSRTKNWVPKFVVLFYDAEKTQYTSFPFLTATSNGAAVNTTNKTGNSSNNTRTTLNAGTNNNNKAPCNHTNYNRYFAGDVGTSDGFWRIYQLYTQINPRLNLNTSNIINMASSGRASVDDMNKLIEDNSSIYLCILNHEPDNYYETIKNGNYLQLYTVDTTVAPFLRSFNSCWLSRFLSRRINANLELIIISLTDNYEFCFVPLCAAKLNATVSFTYEMELANKNKINDEYDGWMFKLWEYSLRSIDYRVSNDTGVDGSFSSVFNSKVNCVNSERNGIDLLTSYPSGNQSANGSTKGVGTSDYGVLNTSNNTCFNSNASTSTDIVVNNDAKVNGRDDKTFLTRCYEYVCSLFFTSSTNNMQTDDPKKDPSNFRTHIIKSINSNKFTDVDQKSKDEKSDNLPSPKNFINWIDKYGFDDLSIKMNMYTLIKR